MKIVILDDAKGRWLVRDESEQPDQAQAYGSLDAVGVQFVGSVAHCQIVEEGGGNRRPSHTDHLLHLKGKSVVMDDGKQVLTCNTLSMRSDGSMVGTVLTIIQ